MAKKKPTSTDRHHEQNLFPKVKNSKYIPKKGDKFAYGYYTTNVVFKTKINPLVVDYLAHCSKMAH